MLVLSPINLQRCDKAAKMHYTLAEPDTPPPPPSQVQIFSFSCSFGGKLTKIIGWRPHLCSWRPLLEILDPPLLYEFMFKYNFCNSFWRTLQSNKSNESFRNKFNKRNWSLYSGADGENGDAALQWRSVRNPSRNNRQQKTKGLTFITYKRWEERARLYQSCMIGTQCNVLIL